MPAKKTGQYRALTDLALRKSPRQGEPGYEDFYEWPEGTVFTPPAHMNVERALERGIVEAVDG